MSYDLLADLDQDSAVQRAWNDEDWPLREMDRSTSYLYVGPTGRLIRVICSHTESAFTPITEYPTCALVNYMDQFSFGCAYPAMTLKHRAVTPNLPNLSWAALARVKRLADFRMERWPEVPNPPAMPSLMKDIFGWADNPLPLWASTVCLRSTFQCPGQARFFGDQGSLLDFFEPDKVDHGVMAHFHHPPYGVTAVWRMESADCTRGCASGDYLLRGALSETSVLACPLHYGPFTTGVLVQVKVGDSQHE